MVRMHPTGSYASARRKAQLNKGTEKKNGKQIPKMEEGNRSQ